MTTTDLETLRGQIELRFQSGNSIQVSDVRLARAEWEALTALLAEYERMLAERDALRERERQLKQLAYQWNENAKDTGFVRIPHYAPQVYENCADELQSIINPTLTGERG